MGYSWGGAEALLAAARRPEAMRSLIMVEPALDLLAQDDPTLATDSAVRDANTRRFLNWMASQTPAEYGEAFRRSAAQRPRRRRIRRRRRPSSHRVRLLLPARTHGPGPRLPRSGGRRHEGAHPVLVISGGWSPAFEKADDPAARILGARRVVVVSPDHYLQLVES